MFRPHHRPYPRVGTIVLVVGGGILVIVAATMTTSWVDDETIRVVRLLIMVAISIVKPLAPRRPLSRFGTAKTTMR